MNMDDNLLTAKEVKAYLKVSRQTLYRLEKSGAVQPVKIGTVKRYRQSDIAQQKKIK
jgi:predicted DNA-binding transcriptional regulator AlpA